MLLEQVVDEVAHLLGIGAEWRVDHGHRDDGTGVSREVTKRDGSARGTLAANVPVGPRPAIAVFAVVLGLASADGVHRRRRRRDTTTTDEPDPNDTRPTTTSARSTPFCAGMIDLAERLDEAAAAATPR